MAMREKMVAPTIVRNVWKRNDLETRSKRMLALEEKSAAKGFKLSEEQIRLLEKHNPEFAERHVETFCPGYLLCQDTFYVGTLKGLCRLYLQAVVDKRRASPPRLSEPGTQTVRDVHPGQEIDRKTQ